MLWIFGIDLERTLIVKNACSVFLQAAPSELLVKEIRKSLCTIEGLLSIRKLHIWQLSESQTVATMHATIHQAKDAMEMTSAIRHIFHEHGVQSATIQCEYPVGSSEFDVVCSSAQIILSVAQALIGL